MQILETVPCAKASLAQHLPRDLDRELAHPVPKCSDFQTTNVWIEIVRHSAYGNTIEVVGEMRANGSTVRESAAAAGGQGRSLGELLERAANDSLQKCAATLLRNGR